MNEIISSLHSFSANSKVENINADLGSNFYSLYNIIRNAKNSIPNELETLLLSLISTRGNKLNNMIANGIGKCLLCYYQSQSIQNYWPFLSLMTEEIPKFNQASIVVLGIMTKGVGCYFKAQLYTHISTLTKANKPDLFPYICQCFRRIVVGTGSFLEKSFPIMLKFIQKCIHSSDQNTRCEAIKSIHVFVSQGKQDYKAMMGILLPNLMIDTEWIRYIAGKTLAKLEHYNCNGDLSVSLKNLTVLLANERNSKTISASMYILLRYFKPIYIISNIKQIIDFLLELPNLKISIETVSMVVYNTIKATFSVVGSTAGRAFGNQMIEAINSDKVTVSKGIILMVTLTLCDVSSKTLQAGSKVIYTLLSSDVPSIRRLAVGYFGAMPAKDLRVAATYSDVFSSVIGNMDPSKEATILGLASSIAMTLSVKNESKMTASVKALFEKPNLSSTRTYAGFIIITALAQLGVAGDEVAMALNIAKTLIGQKIPQKPSKQNIRIIKALAGFLSVLKLPETTHAELNTFISNALLISTKMTAGTLYCLLRLASKITLSKPLTLAIVKAIIVNVSRLMSLEAFDLESVIAPFATDISGITELYGTKPQIAPASFLSNNLKLNGRTHRAGFCRFAMEVFPHFFSNVDVKEQKDAVISLLESGPTDDATAGRLLLVRALLQRRSTVVAFPNDTLPRLLILRPSEVRLQRIVAACVGRWVYYYPVILPAVLEQIESAKPLTKPLFALILAELAPVISKSDSKIIQKSFDIVNAKVAADPTPEILHALAQLTAACGVHSDTTMILNTLFGGFVNTPASIEYFSQAAALFQDTGFKATVAQALYAFPSNKRFAQLSAARTVGSALEYRISEAMRSDSPPRLFISVLNSGVSQDDIPSLMTLMQQTGSRRVADAQLRAFAEFPDVRFWTDLCKRVVLNMCVPPAERVGDSKVIPTRAVLISTMHIATLLADRVRQTFPNDLSCVDDIVSIAFTAVQMKDAKIDHQCYEIAAMIINRFSDIRNKDGAFLDLFMAQFHPMLKHALEDGRKLQSAVEFILGFLGLLEPPLLEDIASLVSQRVESISVTKSTAVILARLISRLFKVAPESAERLQSQFDAAALVIIESSARQEISLADLGAELIDFVSVFVRREAPRSLLLLALSTATEERAPIIIKCATEFGKRGTLKPEDIMFVIPYLKYATRKECDSVKRSFAETAFADTEDDSFYVVPAADSDPSPEFLAVASSVARTPEYAEPRRLLFACAMERSPICYAALGRLIETASPEEIMGLPGIFDSICCEEEESAVAVSYLYVQKISPEFGDLLLSRICSKPTPFAKKISAIRTILNRFGGFRLKSLAPLSSLIEANLFPSGLLFLGQLLDDERTKNTAKEVIRLGAINTLSAEVPMKHIPIVLHFLRLLVPSAPESAAAAASIGLRCVAMTSEVKDRQKVVSVAASLFSAIPGEVLRGAFERADKAKVVKALTPPKKAPQLKLMSLGNGGRRAAQADRGGWQTLTIEDD